MGKDLEQSKECDSHFIGTPECSCRSTQDSKESCPGKIRLDDLLQTNSTCLDVTIKLDELEKSLHRPEITPEVFTATQPVHERSRIYKPGGTGVPCKEQCPTNKCSSNNEPRRRTHARG